MKCGNGLLFAKENKFLMEVHFRTVDFALLNLYIRTVTATMLDDFLNWL